MIQQFWGITVFNRVHFNSLIERDVFDIKDQLLSMIKQMKKYQIRCSQAAPILGDDNLNNIVNYVSCTKRTNTTLRKNSGGRSKILRRSMTQNFEESDRNRENQ